MHMKQVQVVMFTLVLLVLSSVFPASAQELTKEAKVERILALTKADTLIDQMLNQVKSMVASQVPDNFTPEQRATYQKVQDKILDLTKDLALKMRPQQVKIYKDIYSDEEINGLLAFYESPTGHAMVEKMPMMMSQMMLAMQSQMKDFQLEVARIVKESAQQ